VSTQGQLARVRLLGLPVEIHRRAEEQHEALRRELAFVEHAQAADAAPARLEALTAELAGRYSSFTAAPNERLAAAIAAGEPTVDLDYEVPPDIVEATVHLSALLDELDELCREGLLLTLVTPPDLLAYRRWVFGEFVAQIREGREPRAWTHPSESPPPPIEAHGRDEARVVVDGELDLATAPALRSSLVEHLDAGMTRITIDLSGCEFMDSTGLSLLVTTHHRLREAGGGLRLEGISKPVRAVLEMAGALDLFDEG
jgi:anti-anti-sigma factor